MSLNHRKPRPLSRAEGVARDARMIVVAVEDTYIQVDYFAQFQGSRLQIKILPTPTNAPASSPKWVLERLVEYKNEHGEWQDGDEFWISIDKDRWKQRELKEVSRQARDKGIRMIDSNPCFEFWLLLHLMQPEVQYVKCNDVCSALRVAIGVYDKKRLPDGILSRRTLEDAVTRARQIDEGKQDQAWLRENGSRVYQLIERLQELGISICE